MPYCIEALDPTFALVLPAEECYLAGNMLHRSFFPLLAKAGLPKIRFHDLRPSAATLLLSTGTHPKIVRELPGHSQISMTLDTYSHELPSLQEDDVGRLNSLFTNRGCLGR